jgi:type IV pilus assembly protein PilM
MRETLLDFARRELPPPRYLTLPTAGIDVSTSGIKLAALTRKSHGLELSSFGEVRLELGAVVGGEITEHAAVTAAVAKLAKEHKVEFANIALPESRGYLFEADVEGTSYVEWKTAIERHLEEHVPLPPAEVAFDIVPLEMKEGSAHVVGIGYAHRAVDELLSVFDEAKVEVRSIESENFALPRALLPLSSEETVLIIDIGKTTTKLLFVGNRVPHFATTLDVGGHNLTLAVQKHFGVSEEEARRVKAERGIVSGGESDEYLAAMISTVSVIREEILQRLDYWQTRTKEQGHTLVSRAILVGGNATVRGLPEYLSVAFKIPVELGDVFANLASREDWVPPVPYMESLAYGTAIGLALRDHATA